MSSYPLNEAAQRRKRKTDESAIVAQIDSGLAAPRFDSAAAIAFAHRDRVSFAVRTLCDVIPRRKDGPISGYAVATAMLAPTIPAAQLMRLAVACGAYTFRQSTTAPPDFRAFLKSKNTNAAQCALALAGEPQAPWPKLTRQERAAVLLRAIVEAMHNGVVS